MNTEPLQRSHSLDAQLILRNQRQNVAYTCIRTEGNAGSDFAKLGGLLVQLNVSIPKTRDAGQRNGGSEAAEACASNENSKRWVFVRHLV